MTKVIIVIDDPKRDLLPMLLFAKMLNSNGNYNIYLISFSRLSQINLSFFKNAILISNYFRKNNMHLLVAIKYLQNCSIIIYDTEGIGSKDGLQIVRNLNDNKSLHIFFDQYWLWNNIIFDELKKSNINLKKIFVVGSYRFSKTILMLKKKFNVKKKSILINTNFALIDPKYSSGFKKEMELAKKTYDQINSETIKFYFKKRKMFLDNIKLLCNSFPDENFILRPHPFEKDIFWRNKLKHLKNLNIRSEGDVFEEFLSAKALIQNECTTAVEANFLEIPTMSFDWLYNSNHDPFMPREASYKCKNLEEAKEFLISIIEDKNINCETEKEKFMKYYTDASGDLDVFQKCIKNIEKIKYEKINLSLLSFFYLSKFFIFRIYNLIFKSNKIVSNDKNINIEMIEGKIFKFKLGLKVNCIDNKIYLVR